MSRPHGPWQIMAQQNEDDSWTASVTVDEEPAVTREAKSYDEAVEQVKDAWRREQGEAYTDQDFVVTAMGK